MAAVKLIFRAIDILFDGAQNNRREYKDPEGKIKIEKDITYNPKYPDMCGADFYYIDNKGGAKYPVVLYIHGGGWEAGDKKYRSGISKWYATNGWFVVNINYGLSPAVKYPLPMQQVVSAYNYIVENAKRLNFDLKNFIVTGDSAGAYFAMMLAAIDRNKGLQEKLECKLDYPVQGMVLNCGMYDLRQLVSQRLIFNLGNSMLKDYIASGRKDFEENEYANFLSPIDFVTPNFPPCFVTYAKKDLFCGGQGELLISKLVRNSVYYEQYHSKDILNNHCYSINMKSKSAQHNAEKTLDFLNRFKNRANNQKWMLTDEQKDEHDIYKLAKKANRRIYKAKKRSDKAFEKIEKHEN